MFIALQHSALSGFAYDLFDSGNSQVGTLCWPDIAVAKNARFENPAPGLLSSTIEIMYNGHSYQVAFEYLNREWFNDIRFTLLDGGTVLASADVLHQKKMFKRPSITLAAPFAGQVIRKSGFFTLRYEIMGASATLGTVSEKGGVTLTRQLSIDLPDSISAPVQFFILFLVHNHAYR
ncbi:MAG: hypothetical protein HXX11_20165 [Desulfuromonadales bacterium]|nr:hypothetical protein [Desulfuromonadales bacterium]